MNIIAPPSKPPIAVSAAVALHAASFAIGFINLLLSIGLHTAGRAIAWLIALGIIYIYLSAIYKGRNWVRWLSIVLSIAGIAGMPWTLPLRPTLVDKEVYVVQAILIGAASVLLLLPAAGQWFRPNNSFKPKPLRGSA